MQCACWGRPCNLRSCGTEAAADRCRQNVVQITHQPCSSQHGSCVARHQHRLPLWKPAHNDDCIVPHADGRLRCLQHRYVRLLNSSCVGFAHSPRVAHIRRPLTCAHSCVTSSHWYRSLVVLIQYVCMWASRQRAAVHSHLPIVLTRVFQPPWQLEQPVSIEAWKRCGFH